MPKQKYRAKNVIDYLSTRTNKYAHVEHGDEFDDMSPLAARLELEHGNIERVEGGETK
jgi:hypothetical protein